jgi:hypothetical protein
MSTPFEIPSWLVAKPPSPPVDDHRVEGLVNGFIAGKQDALFDAPDACYRTEGGDGAPAIAQRLPDLEKAGVPVLEPALTPDESTGSLNGIEVGPAIGYERHRNLEFANRPQGQLAHDGQCRGSLQALIHRLGDGPTCPGEVESGMRETLLGNIIG